MITNFLTYSYQSNKSTQPASLVITNCNTYSYQQAKTVRHQLMAAMYEDYSAKLTAA